MKTLLSLFTALLLLPALLHAQADSEKVQNLIDEALEDFKESKYDKAVPKLVEADKLSPNSTFVLNLLGAAYTKQKNYTAADGKFRQALEIDYNFFPAAFNLGEVLFLQKQYPQALDYFIKLLRNNPSNELLQFKVILCLILTDQIADAKNVISRMRLPGQEPAWYYAQAAVALKENKKGEAMKYMSAGNTLFPERSSLYKETFTDLGWPTAK